jgi:hypothetical protein
MVQARPANRPARESRAVERFQFATRCTMHAAVTKSPLDRLFFSRFELQNWKKIFVELFHKYIFFVLVCGPFLLIENFSHFSKPVRRAGWKMGSFHTAIIGFRPLF